ELISYCDEEIKEKVRWLDSMGDEDPTPEQRDTYNESETLPEPTFIRCAVDADADDEEQLLGQEDSPLLHRAVPTDRGNVIYIGFLLLGLGTLLPWNFFITAQTYWEYKFRNTTIHNETVYGLERTHLQQLYTPMQVCFSQIPNFTFLFINALFGHKVRQRLRLVASLVMMIVFFSLTTILTKINTDCWQLGFFILTMIIIVLINSSGAIFQGGLFGVAGQFPEQYMTAVVAGQALGGVFASASRIISLSVGAKDDTSAFIYFLIAVMVMIVTLIAYLYMSKTNFYKHYTTHRSGEKEAMKGEEAIPSPGTSFKAQLAIFKEIWPLGVSVWAVFAVTLAAFPALCVKILSTSENRVWADLYFQPVITFLLFNVGDYVGRQVAGFIMWPKRGSRIVYILVTLRLVFIPLFLLCNHSTSSPIPSLFPHDGWYIFFMLLFSISNGYCSSLCMMYAPKMVTEDKAETASSMMAALLGLGLLTGALLSFAFALIT
ncbi:hypothetical protein Pcinc_023801, partial [Petrolisthes cinctipes]